MRRITIGSLAAAGGTQVTTIRYYERAGLMPVPERTAGAHRVYTDEQLKRLLFIRRAREMGFSITEIKTLLALADPARTSCRDVQQIAAAHLNKIHERIMALVQLETMLTDTVARCSGKPTAPCPVLDLLAADGAGNADHKAGARRRALTDAAGRSR
jgi:MerR family transcriptional regulator, mercuric resistance operon regulatory protein